MLPLLPAFAATNSLFHAAFSFAIDHDSRRHCHYYLPLSSSADCAFRLTRHGCHAVYYFHFALIFAFISTPLSLFSFTFFIIYPLLSSPFHDIVAENAENGAE